MADSTEREWLTVAGRDIAISNPKKVLFPQAGYTKLDLARYYVAVADGALRGAGGRPNVLVRYPDGVGGEFFYQKRAPRARPDWVDVVALRFPSGRSAEEVVPRDAAALVWMANLACLELHPHPVRADDLDHPDELRVDLDPGTRRDVGSGPRGRPRRPCDPRGFPSCRLAEDLGLARHARGRADRAALDIRRRAPGGARTGARSGASRARVRHEQVVEGRTARRVPRLQPERQGPHGGERVLRAADARRTRLGPADVG